MNDSGKSQDTAFFGKVLQALLLTAFSPDNFDPFLKKTLDILSGPAGLGKKAGLAIIIKGEDGASNKGTFLGFSAAQRARLLGAKKPAAGGRFFCADITAGNARAGKLCAYFAALPRDAQAVQSILDMSAKVISARLQDEQRDAELRREKDLDASVSHIEEIYLSLPGISTEEISRAVLDEARRLTCSELGFAGHVDPETGCLTISTFTGEVWDKCGMKEKPTVFRDFKGLWGWVLKRKKPLLTNKAAGDKRSVGLPPGHLKIDRFLGVPAMSGRKLVGMLALANPRADYSAHDLRAAQKLARAYAIILKHQLAEAKQREEDARFRAIVASSKDVIYTADLEGRLSYVSPRVEEYGYTQEELIGTTVNELAHPDDKEFVTKAYANAARTGRTLPILPYRFKTKNGGYIYAEQKSSIVFKDGRPLYITGVMRDVEEQKRTERLLKESETLMRMVFETATDSIFIKDMNGMYMKVNGTCAQWMGKAPADMIGHTDSDYFDAETAAKIFRTDSEVVRTGRTMSLNNNYVFPTGRRHINIVKTPLKGIAGNVIGILGIARDISDIKRMEAELALTRAAEEVSKVARPMAHDFNNALAAINGYATLIDDDLPASSPIKNEISRIIQAVQRAAELTSKFQDFARNPKLGGPEEAK
jgi:PAS domain S-box-containing protein